MTRRLSLPPLDADRQPIQPCESRLALSASLAADLLLDALDWSPADPWSGQNYWGQNSWQATPIATQSTAAASAGLDASDLSANPDPLNPTFAGSVANLMDQAATAGGPAGLAGGTAGLDGAGQTVAVIDSGVAWDHVALGGGFGSGYRVVGGWDFAEQDANPYDDGPAGFHGTHVAALLAGRHDAANPADDFRGVAPGADIVALRVLDDAGRGQLQWIESALQWVHQHKDSFASPITTVNLSIGAALTETNAAEAAAMLQDELALLRRDNILVFAAAGNFFADDPTAGVMYPSSSPTVVAVGSVDAAGQLSDFSQRHGGLLAAPGETVRSAVPDHVFGWDGRVDDFAPLSGTSMATPQVAAASMLVRQSMIDQGLQPTADDILTRLRSTAVTHTDAITSLPYHTIDLHAAVASPLTGSAAPLADHYHGSNDGEQVELDLRDGIVIRVGGQTTRLDPAAGDSPLMIDVGGGDDSLVIWGSPAAERLILHAQLDATSTIATNEYEIQLRGFENVVFRGGGGPDRASLFDSAGSDTLESRPGTATLRGTGFRFDVDDVSRIYVHGTAGGTDTAFLHDSDGDDALAVRPQFSSMRSDAAFQLAYGFERVYAYAGQGGIDTAEMFDSDGDDTLSISAARSILTGPGYHVSASGFAATSGHATAGGNDIARLYADDPSAHWSVTADMVQWTDGQGLQRLARGFERSEAFEQYQPIELIPLSTSHDWLAATAQEARRRDLLHADATRAVFDALGEF